MRQVLLALGDAGCPRVWIDGSFVTAKPHPADYDICWELEGVEYERVPKTLFIMEEGRAAQKAWSGGEWIGIRENSPSGRVWLGNFQIDFRTGRAKGFVVLELTEFQDDR